MKQEHEVAPVQGAPTEAVPLPMRYDVRIYSLGTDGNTLANAGVNINGAFAIRGVKVVSGSKGPFVSMPSYRTGNGEYRDICFPCTKEARQEFDSAVLEAYQQALTQLPQRQQGAPAQEQSAPEIAM